MPNVRVSTTAAHDRTRTRDSTECEGTRERAPMASGATAGQPPFGHQPVRATVANHSATRSRDRHLARCRSVHQPRMIIFPEPANELRELRQSDRRIRSDDRGGTGNQAQPTLRLSKVIMHQSLAVVAWTNVKNLP